MTNRYDSDNEYYTEAELKINERQKQEELEDEKFNELCKIYDNMKGYLEDHNITFILDKCTFNDFCDDYASVNTCAIFLIWYLNFLI